MRDKPPKVAPHGLLSRLFPRLAPGREELLSGPLRGELLGPDQLAEKARALARTQQWDAVSTQWKEAPLLTRLAQSRRILEESHARLAAGAARGVDVGPAGEWLLDNFHVVREHIREIHESLPRGYYRELPELTGGPLAGYPRIYELTITLISHTEGRVDRQNLDGFMAAYQSVKHLSIGELWSVSAMLRLALIESVRRMTLRTVQRMDHIEEADAWAARIAAAADQGESALGIALDGFVRSHPLLTAAFVSRLLHQLRLIAGSYPLLAQIEQWISDRSLAPEDAIARATQHLALTQVIMAHSITSLRTIAHLDWASFVDGQSAMEPVLREDPTGCYARMTFGTRDRYRHVVERIARRTGLGEEAVARTAVDLARSAPAGGAAPSLQAHVGYYLVDEGLPRLEAATGYRKPPGEALHRWLLRHPNLVFGGGIAAATTAALAALSFLAGPAAQAAAPLVFLLALIPAADLAISAVNQVITAWLPPRTLPKLDLRGKAGVPAEFRTAVVVPTLFDSVEAVQEALANLEVQFLANRGANLHFAVLSDFTDAATETVEGDDAIVAAGVEGVRALNARYAPGTDDAFYFLHRPRRWNPRQGAFMGWERKRGKLAQFNRFLRGGADDAFSVVVGAVEPLRKVRYVITLDADTVLPPDAAPDLIGALAHPLNRAVYDEASGRVVRGYGILQPRVGVSLPSAHRSRFAAIHSGHPGVDPYTTAVSDVYQDLYGEGSFTGKGIYDVDAFEQATRGRFPENTLLSHDLVEGNYARAGLVTEIVVYDDYPSRYLVHARRKHRWIRGDWQLLGWLTGEVPGLAGPEPNRLNFLSRWKILDNLRRSTVEIGHLAFLVAGWTVLPGSPLRWTALALAAVAGPWIVALALGALRPPRDRSWRAYYAGLGHDAVTSVQQVALVLTFLAHQAWLSGDAIVRTLWRLLVSRRYLLEWQTASSSERSVSSGAAGVWREMAPAVGLGAAIGLGLMALAAAGAGSAPLWQLALAASPLLLLWIFSPAVAHLLGAPPVRPQEKLPLADRTRTERLALLHWHFYERFTGPDTHWLVPDNFQDDPAPVVAMRTSPTNIGLQLLAIVSARDLGFITTADMARRLDLAFQAMDRLARFKGHFFNWYELHELRVLEPAYVSTVDSGNLAGHLLAVRQACLAAAAEPAGIVPALPALRTALRLAHERLGGAASDLPQASGAGKQALDLAGGHLVAAREHLAGMDADSSVDAFTALAALLRKCLDALAQAKLPQPSLAAAQEWIDWSARRADQHADEATANAGGLRTRLEALAEQAHGIVVAMEFGFLFDRERELFSIGYQHASHTLDPSYYDLFASEARLASFVAIAKGDVPADHWFRLGRTLTHAGGHTALISWSGSMFEYLMPALVMRAYPFTLLDQTYQGAVRRQIAYGTELGLPWGVSESAYNLRDRHLTYQYRAFGVPDLALKRGLGRDLVVAPYASALALMVDPARALGNLAVLEHRGALGRYGFRDALDYTRPDPGKPYALVENYMAHHIGMSLVAFTNLLTGQVWHARFHADPLVRSVELLLHERIPRRLVYDTPQATDPDEGLPAPELESPVVREFIDPDTPHPHVAMLGRLPYKLMVSHCGSGYSRYNDIAVTRWRADATTDATGQFCYVKDVTQGRAWSAAHQPTCAPADAYRALLATDRITFERRDGAIETRTEIVVVPEDAAEVRKVKLRNHGTETVEIELTSYGEVVLGGIESDRAHPAFAKLFVETEWHEWCSAITATRRPRTGKEEPLWCVHVASTCPDQVGPVSCETDRARFVGRGRTTRSPAALSIDGPLSGTTGAVLDPIFSLRTRVRLAPGQATAVTFTTLVATSRARAFELADRYHHPSAAERALELAWTSQQLELRELGLTPAHVADFQELAGYLFFPRPELRASQEDLLRNRGSQPLLWEVGVSGDWPVVLASIDSPDGLPTLRQLLAAHHYWRRRGMTVDLVVFNTQAASYLQELHNKILEVMFTASDTEMDRPGGVFIRRRDQLGADALRMLEATASLSVRCEARPLVDSVVRRVVGEVGRVKPPPSLAAQPWRRDDEARGPAPAAPSGALLFDNGFGGLDAAGDYLMRIRGDRLPPAPWSNVIANPQGGFVVSERGTGFTWAENSYFYRLTPWHNDPVSDPASEVLYLRDEASGELWSATPAPMGRDTTYTVRHGAGATVFEGTHGQIGTRLTLGMAEGEAVKLSVLEVTNHGPQPRRICVTAYVEWSLGVNREHTQHQVHTRFDPELRAMLASNRFDPYFADWVAVCALSAPVTGHTADRREFLGRNGTVEDPAALRGGPLAQTTGLGFDPCAAMQCVLELAPGETRELSMVLGAAATQDEARRIISRYVVPGAAAAASAGSLAQWARRLAVVRVRTPEPSFDAMINRWTLYQALSCRMWARSALYQSGGAYGFRDQLQDVLAFLYAEPGIAREHILRATARQFVEGDVQHWWHPQSGRGVRTRFSDDLAWLPHVVDQYVRVTGDAALLDEYVPFLVMRPLEPHEHEVYDLPQVTDEHASVYEHCLRALRKACTAGPHGLPLIGIGDWNDGMNRVGVEGRGETVWLAWFLIATLRAFAPYADARGDGEVAADFRARADGYAAAVEAHGWDGGWYRRAYFDDGTPLGSTSNTECRIDSIAQSWSVISGAAPPERQARALRALEDHLVRPKDQLLVLLTPPFDKSAQDPGYIKGYLPGVRENGAQYTHAALWAVLAAAMQGDGDRAFDWFQMINPLMHARTLAEVDVYKVEPYVVAADVYTAPGQVGRGGWTWYTGSASWMYRVGLEAILGFTKRGDTLRIEPRVPAAWPEFSIDYRFGSAVYAITVRQPGEFARRGVDMTVDRRLLQEPVLHLADDGARHEVVVSPRG
ncbi:MAG: hypothetical protein K0S57_1108 [Ramlibacter sp.]|nr:hypothetical protein [Ramlibacter sp.]